MRSWENVTGEPDRLGESPFWHPVEQCLYWVDIPGKRLKRMGVGRAVETWEMPSEPGCIAPVESGGLVIALRDGVYRAASWGTLLECVVPFGHDTSKFRFNDGKADPLGRFWAGTMYEPKDERRAELFCIDMRPDNGNGGAPIVTAKAGNATTANGLAWSPDGRTLYWADTPQHVIRAWDWDAAGNSLHNARVFHQFTPKPPGWQPDDAGYGGRPDGAAVDSQGNYWCAMYEGRRLVKLSPAGLVVDEIETPTLSPTMPCFGGADLCTLYVTGAGGPVIATRVDVPGLPVNFVRA